MACVQGKIGSSLYAGSVELSEEFKKKYIELYGRLLYNLTLVSDIQKWR